MDPNYTVTTIICVLSMIILAIDVGKNTILNKDDIKWFRITFILAAIGACFEYCGVLSDKTNLFSQKIHWFITFTEFCISPYLGICLARSSGMRKSVKPMLIIMTLNVLIEVISLFTGIVFYIDSDSVFHRGSAYWSYLLFCVLDFIYVLFVFILNGIRAKIRYLINILLITSIMIIGQAANTINGEINSGYMSICVTAVLLYICIQNMLRHVMIETINVEKKISHHDALTKVHSRVSYNDIVEDFNKMIECKAEGIKFAVCECDLNNLKIVNDSFGHEVGDKYLISCCKTICNIFKHSPVFRIGGDEFVIILQNDDYEKIDKLKQTVDDLSIREINKDVPLFEKKSFASGFAVYDHRRDTSFCDVFKRADQAMYENKKMLKSLK
jgi:diguanylate cyclase (GGDEF)-like protein